MAIGNRSRTGARDYYDSNTGKFLLSGSERAIHRELWGPDVTTRGEAVHHARAQVLDQLGAGDRACSTSVAGSARPRCASRGGGRWRSSGSRSAQCRSGWRTAPPPAAARCWATCACGGQLTALPDDLTGFDLAFAIEGFVHADPAAAFFEGSPARCAPAAR